jgi:ABC-type hemin transport system substrate-binding protein
MSKWTRTRRDPSRTYTDETTERTERMIARIRKFMQEGVLEDEPEFVVAVKDANPKITASELKEVITQFRAVVSERQQRGLGRR